MWYIRAVGLDEATIAYIATAEYHGVVGSGGDCTGSLGEFNEGELVCVLHRCAHPFHAPCIDTSLKFQQEAAELAGWEDEQLEFITEKVTEEGKHEDLNKRKAPEQVVLDEAAFVMDLATVDGNFEDVVDRIAECYREAKLHDIANSIAYRE